MNKTRKMLECGANFCPSQLNDEMKSQQAVDKEIATRLFWIYFSISVVGILLVFVLLSNLHENSTSAASTNMIRSKKKSFKREIGGVLILLKDTTIIKLSVISIGGGASVGFIYADLTQVYKTILI